MSAAILDGVIAAPALAPRERYQDIQGSAFVAKEVVAKLSTGANPPPFPLQRPVAEQSRKRAISKPCSDPSHKALRNCRLEKSNRNLATLLQVEATLDKHLPGWIADKQVSPAPTTAT